MEGAQAGPSFLAPRLFHHPRRADSSRAMQRPAVPEPQAGAYVSAPLSDRKLRAVKDAAPDQVASLVARAAEGDRAQVPGWPDQPRDRGHTRDLYRRGQREAVARPREAPGAPRGGRG